MQSACALRAHVSHASQQGVSNSKHTRMLVCTRQLPLGLEERSQRNACTYSDIFFIVDEVFVTSKNLKNTEDNLKNHILCQTVACCQCRHWPQDAGGLEAGARKQVVLTCHCIFCKECALQEEAKTQQQQAKKEKGERISNHYELQQDVHNPGERIKVGCGSSEGG